MKQDDGTGLLSKYGQAEIRAPKKVVLELNVSSLDISAINLRPYCSSGKFHRRTERTDQGVGQKQRD